MEIADKAAETVASTILHCMRQEVDDDGCILVPFESFLRLAEAYILLREAKEKQ